MRKLKDFKWLSGLTLCMLAALTVSLAIFFTHPSNATTVRYQQQQQMIREGAFDEVKTPSEMGMDYLQQRPPQLVASLMDSIHEARGIVQSTSNVIVKVPFPSSPYARIQTGVRLPDGRIMGESGDEVDRFRAEVVMNRRNGQTTPVTSLLLDEMFALEERSGGSINAGEIREIAKNPYSLVADASGSFWQAKRYLTIDIGALDTWTGRRILFTDVSADAFCRDALNAVLEGTLEL